MRSVAKLVLALGPALALLPGAAGAQEALSPSPRYDVLIRGGIVVDGTGAPRFSADVAVAGDRIAAVEKEGIDPRLAHTVIDARGQVVTPGFIDNHAHVQSSIADYPLAENFLRQGITTILASLHSGDQPWPLREFASHLEMAPNVGFFAGADHGLRDESNQVDYHSELFR
ncbi:MAG: hypothetical protein ACE5GJ_02400 [Gemmatimonadota bacterium]